MQNILEKSDDAKFLLIGDQNFLIYKPDNTCEGRLSTPLYFRFFKTFLCISNSTRASFIKHSAAVTALRFPFIPLQLRSNCQSARLASTGKSYSDLCSTALNFLDFTARYRKF